MQLCTTDEGAFAPTALVVKINVKNIVLDQQTLVDRRQNQQGIIFWSVSLKKQKVKTYRPGLGLRGLSLRESRPMDKLFQLVFENFFFTLIFVMEF